MRSRGAGETLRGMHTTTSRLAGELRAHGFTGRLEEPGHVGYDLARQGFNGAIDRHPAAIAFARDAEDVGGRAPRRAGRRARRSPSAAAGTRSPGARSATARCASTCARSTAFTSTRERGGCGWAEARS